MTCLCQLTLRTTGLSMGQIATSPSSEAVCFDEFWCPLWSKICGGSLAGKLPPGSCSLRLVFVYAVEFRNFYLLLVVMFFLLVRYSSISWSLPQENKNWKFSWTRWHVGLLNSFYLLTSSVVICQSCKMENRIFSFMMKKFYVDILPNLDS